MSEPGLVWERNTFGALCFATYYKASIEFPFEIKDIALDFFGTDKGEVVSSAEKHWLAELLQGCKAKVFISNVPRRLKYNKERADGIYDCRLRCIKTKYNSCIRY